MRRKISSVSLVFRIEHFNERRSSKKNRERRMETHVTWRLSCLVKDDDNPNSRSKVETTTPVVENEATGK